MNSQAGSVHVVFGEVAQSNLRLVLPSNDIVLVQRDILSFGKVQEIDSVEGWKLLRNFELNRLYGTTGIDYLNEPDELINGISILKKANKITLWCGIGLEDQLLKAFLIRLVVRIGKDIPSVLCHQFTTLDNTHHPVTTIGFLSFDDFLDIGKPIEVSLQQAETYLNFWNEYTSGIPKGLISPKNRKAKGDELFNNTICCLIRRFPSIDTGLNYWQRQILIEAENIESTSKILSHNLNHIPESSDFVTEAYLRYELRQLCSKQKLLQVSNHMPLSHGSKVKLTIKAQSILRASCTIAFPSDTEHWIGGISLVDIFSHWRADNSYTTLTKI